MRILRISVIFMKLICVNGNFLDGLSNQMITSYSNDLMKAMIYESTVQFLSNFAYPHSNLHSETFEIDIAIGWTPQLEYWYYRVRIRSFTTIWYVAIHVQRLLLISAILIPVNLNSKIEFWHHYYLLHFCQSSSWIVVLEFIKWWCF